MADSTDRSSKPRPPKAKARSIWLKIFVWLGLPTLLLALTGALVFVYALIVMASNLPSLDTLTDYRPKMPLRIYTKDHVLIGEFGAERREMVKLEAMPETLKNAILAIEDNRFYTHGGVDFIGILRATVVDILHRGNAQGASTITMQVARNFFLTREKTYLRKLYEMLLAYNIESVLTKDEILELYMNQIYLGQRAYGFAAAARVYFGKDLSKITLAQAAMLAGLPKAPSAYNPIVNPKRAKTRQQYILKRMLELGYINQPQYEQAINEEIEVQSAGNEFKVHAEYVAEMVRQKIFEQYHEEAYTRGLRVITTLDSADQEAAYKAVRRGIMNYERRHGYRGPEAFITLPERATEAEEAINDALLARPNGGEFVPAVVMLVKGKTVFAEMLDGTKVSITGDALRFAAASLRVNAPNNKRIRPGAVIRLVKNPQGEWEITQLPQLEGALVSLTPQDGAIRALVGGFDFNKNKFNHITQAWRQPGSSFKPFIYSAALDKGVLPATVINDAPLSLSVEQTGGEEWTPKNYGGRYSGAITLRTALEKSVNLASIRILNHIGAKYGQEYVTQKFGFDADKTPPYLSMALGTGLVTPWQLARAYAVFANGGYRINPYVIDEVTDAEGTVLSRAEPLVAGQGAPHVLDPRNEYIMTDLLQSVAQHGTGARTNVLNRNDLAGKTGTTNDSLDTWFAGFQPTLTAVAWLGYDQPKSLGDRETGGGLALPIWIDYMRQALRNVPAYQWPQPPGVVEIDDELYYDTFRPGKGFVEKIGFDDEPLTGDTNDLSASTAAATAERDAGMTSPAAATIENNSANSPDALQNEVNDAEKQSILNIFDEE